MLLGSNTFVPKRKSFNATEDSIKSTYVHAHDVTSNLKLEKYFKHFNPRSLLEKIVTQGLEGGNQLDPPSSFDTIHPIDLKFGTYYKLRLYFQLSETTWCLSGFHGNNSQINDVTGGRHLGFSNFQILFKFSFFYLRLNGKQHLAVEIH